LRWIILRNVRALPFCTRQKIRMAKSMRLQYDDKPKALTGEG